jgi:acyl carrier protein
MERKHESSPEGPVTTVVEIDAARTAVVQGLADVEGLEVVDVEAAIAAAGGDRALHLDSKQAEVIIAFVEAVFGCELPSPADLRRDQFSTLAALVELVAPCIVVPAEV